MKKRFLLILTIIFALNTLSLSALAAPCPHMQNTSIQKASADLPPCHKKMQEERKSQGHCKGICFCLHAQLSHNVLLPETNILPARIVKQSPFYLPQTYSYLQTIAPPLRPPMSLS